MARLLTSLDSLRAFPSEVIVVADQDDSKTSSVLEGWGTKCRKFEMKVLKQQQGMGPGAARNRGAASANQDKVAFIDDDCVASPEWLARIVDKVDARKKVVGAGGRVVPLGKDTISRYYGHYGILEPPRSLEYLVSANCCYLRDPLLDVGGFEEDITKPGGEDVGLSFKLAQIGWQFGFAEDALVYHDFRGSISDFVTTFRNYGAGVHRASVLHQPIRTQTISSTFHSGGYGYGSLAPSGIGPSSLLREAASVFRSAGRDYGWRGALAFSGLRAIQRLSYYYGWLSG